MKPITLIILLALFPLQFNAQTLQSIVADTDTKEPLQLASAYFEGSSLGAISNTEGKFSFTVKNRLNAHLVVSCIGYESVLIINPFKSMPDTVFLEKKNYTIDDIEVVSKTLFSREQKMRTFKEEFLGTTRSAKKCKILNEDSLSLIFDKKNNTLHARSNVPLDIINHYLGYKIRWEIVDFTIYYKNSKSLKHHNIDSVINVGLPFFEPVLERNLVYKNHRKEIYDFSQRRFFKLLVENKISSDEYRIFLDRDIYINPLSAERNEQINFSKIFLKTDSVFITNKQSNEEIRLSPSILNSSGRFEVNLITVRIVPIGDKRYDGRYKSAKIQGQDFHSTSWSKLCFLKSDFTVDYYGNTDLLQSHSLYIDGTMGNQRVGDMLPMDYLPEN